MQTFRDILKEADLTLFMALENSWKIARDEWTPMLKMDSESHAGLPHLQSVEEWMDKIAEACRPIWSQHSTVPFGFNPLEVYMALCAALFHDIGRGRRTDDHGKTSREIINDNWAQLGIVSGRIAYELGHICEFHTAEHKWTEHDAVKIHPWGIVHTEAIASLLTLADELDTAYTRAAPQYMKDRELLFEDDTPIKLSKMEKMADDYFSKGLYRDFISDVDLDTSSHLIKTVLFSDRLPGRKCLESKTGSAKWLELLRATPPAMEHFRPEDYFFSYLEHLRPEVHSEVLEFHAAQFHKALDFTRAGLLRDFRPPSQYRDRGNLLYDLQLWGRQTTGMSRTARDRVLKEAKDLEGTVKLIRNTVEYIEKIIEESDVKDRGVRLKLSSKHRGLLRRIGGSIYYLEKRKRIVDDEAQSGPRITRERLEELPDTWDGRLPNIDDGTKEAFVESMKPVEAAIGKLVNPSGGENVTPNEAHAKLVDLMHYLTYVDLRDLPESGWRNCATRQWESWTVEDFHSNLLLAFHIYLANIRFLIHDPPNPDASDDLDYRYLAYGKVERPFGDGAHVGVECQVVGMFTDLIGAASSTVDAKPKAGSQGEGADKTGKHLFSKLDEYLKRCQDYGGDHSMLAADFRFSVKLIFMQWLSGDVDCKNITLKRISPGLKKLEIPFDEWLIEYNNHLFDKDWKLCLEPSLKQKHILDTAEKAFQLRKSLHRDEPRIPWETLAAALRDPKMERVKTSAARLSNLLRIYSDLPDVDLKAMEQVKREWQLSFGHLLLSELEGEDRKDRAVSLETSHSAWRLRLSSDAESHENATYGSLEKFLKGLHDENGGSDNDSKRIG